MTIEYVNRHRLDKEVTGLVLALNSIEGIHTFESCCGHGQHSFWIVFQVESPESLARALWWFRQSHTLHDYDEWVVLVRTDVEMDKIYYTLKGPSGEQAYKEANALATLILDRVPRDSPSWIVHLWEQLRKREE